MNVRVWQVAAIVFGIAFLSGVAWLSVQVSDRSSPTADVRLDALPVTVEQGEALQIDENAFYRRSCQVTLTRRLYDAHGEKYALAEMKLPAGTLGPVHSVSTVVTSPSFALGEGRYVSSPRYGCNWFQRMFWPITGPDRVVSFLVVKRK